ncbi:myc target protein 1 homolog [Scleropages formosus]|nr:myc target protein 1 [Scleropages formosus]
MAENHTDLVSEFLKSFDVGSLVLAFCLSMLVGLLIGALIYILLTWMSRRRASASITRRPARQSRSSPHSFLHGRPAFGRNSSYDRRSNNSLASAAFSFHRQASLEQADPLGRKPSFRASTFHPLLPSSPGEVEDGRYTATPLTHSPTTQPDSLWCSSNLRVLQVTQTPPPAYDSIIRAFQETCT